MGDSDDEFDQKRSREKYRRGDDGDGGNWNDRNSGRRDGGWQRGGPYNNNNNRNQQQAPYGNNRSKQFSPPDRNLGNKRRREWDEDDDRGDRRMAGNRSMENNDGPTGPTQPAMMSFKQYLASLDDAVDDEDAIQRYREYKNEFKRQQIHEFFLAHKDEEWFRQKYHPEESTVRKQEKQQFLQQRLSAFMELLKLHKVEEIALEIDNTIQIVRFLDMAFILMEGGNEDDFKALDESKDHAGNGEDAAEKEDAGGNGDPSEMDATEGSETADEPDSKKSELGVTKRRVFHKTASIFLRNLPPSITRSEVEAVCKRFPGFLKLAIAEPLPERRFFRRGWATFGPDVNIKEICWNLSNIRLRETELGAIVNRDITRRIRSTTGIAGHKPTVRACIQIAARIIQNLDSQTGLWTSEEGKAKPDQVFISKSRNPILKGITDYLIEEGSAEEDEYEGVERSERKASEDRQMDTDDNAPTIEKDLELTRVLDRLILYIRIVHSLDFYNYCDYPQEDEMPNRCGIVHVRGPPPPHQVTPEDVSVYVKNLESKLSNWILPKHAYTKTEMEDLGVKDAEKEVERFVEANTKKQSEDKWLCPLSGKKFKGPDFIRKHIFNKHGEKVEEVRKDVEYFNNYLLDPKRPSLPEHPQSTQTNQGRGQGSSNNAERGGPPGFGFGHPLAGRLGFPGMPFPMPPGPFPPFMGMPPMGHMGMGGMHGDFFGRGMGPRRGNFGHRRDGRDMVSYKDLDAPGDDDY